MAEYQKIEYRIGKDGTIVETVLNAAGASCIETTAAIEQALGIVESQKRLPEYDSDETITAETLELVQQKE